MTQAEPHPAYADYQESDALWLGKAPAGWETAPMKHLTQFINGTAFKPGDWGTEGVPIIRIENLNGGADFNRTTRQVPSKYHVKRGDLLFGWSGNRGTSFGPYIWEQDGLFYLNQHIFRLEGFRGHRRWFYWMLKAVTFYVEQQAHGIIGMVHITKGDLGAIKVPIPSLADQETIASFLDWETARLDGLVVQKEKLLALLEEKRASLITHAVTSGLNPHAPTKPSGIPWLGSIPKHWQVAPLKRVCKFVKDGTHLPPPRVALGFPMLSVRNIIGDKFGNLPDDTQISEADFTTLRSTYQPTAGDIVLAIVGATIGKVAIVPELPAFIIQRSLGWLRTRPERILNHFAYRFMQSRSFQEALWLDIGFSAQPGIYLGTLANLPIALPPVAEQKEIAAYVTQKTESIAALRSKVEQAITKLRERRTALISAAVTGQIDVRNWKPAA